MRSINANMGKSRLEAFSDGVIAIIITIMVLEMKVPGRGHSELSDLKEMWPVFTSYIISFIYVGIYWNNHHHMFHAVRSINGSILWANLHLLFWLSVVPFVSAWIGENSFRAVWPVVTYGVVLLMNAVAYSILVLVLIKHEGKNSPLAVALGNDFKGKISIVMYLSGIACAWVNTYLSFAFYVVVALIWLVPDRRIEKKLATDQQDIN